jgi:predicted alpha/beta hydrolase family esterase
VKQDPFPPRGFKRLREIRSMVRHLPRTLGHGGPRGPKDGPPALVIPGFLAHDRHTTELRRALAEVGYRVFPWREGFNLGAREDTLERLQRALGRCEASEPVLLVGWSLGGLYARELARAAPDKVRAVVTMGSPVWGDRRRYTSVWRLYEFVTRHAVDNPPIPDHAEKPPVPTLALWSRRDGIVAAPCARGTEACRDCEVELETSHMGFAMSHQTTRAVVREIDHFLRRTEAAESAH